MESKPSPSNLAFTGEPLQMHTDLPYYENMPGVSIWIYMGLVYCQNNTFQAISNLLKLVHLLNNDIKKQELVFIFLLTFPWLKSSSVIKITHLDNMILFLFFSVIFFWSNLLNLVTKYHFQNYKKNVKNVQIKNNCRRILFYPGKSNWECLREKNLVRD